MAWMPAYIAAPNILSMISMITAHVQEENNLTAQKIVGTRE
jgi:hypothetical protein